MGECRWHEFDSLCHLEPIISQLGHILAGLVVENGAGNLESVGSSAGCDKENLNRVVTCFR